MPRQDDGPNEAETLAALEEKRLEALKIAVPRLIQLNREIASRNKSKADVYANLEKRGVTVGPFKEAMKRALRDTEQLQMFDEEASALEVLIRKICSGAQAEEDRSANETAAAAEERRENVVDIKSAKDKKAGKKAAKPKAAAKTSKKKEAGSAESGPTEVREPEGDPDFRRKIRTVMAEDGAEGLSADQIPMPGQEHRPPQPAQQAGFVDRTPRMPAAEARRLIGADDDVLGHS
jgi:hypothetical protein